MKMSKADRIAIEREVAKQSLAAFMRMAWHVLEPAEPFVHNWHIDAFGEHLQAVTAGEILRLLINVPSGTMKSMATSVFWPAWIWGPANKAHQRFIGASHEVGLATRDSRRMKMLVESDWYQERWPTELSKSQNEKRLFENSQRGFRQAVPVASMTGKRGHVILWDDPSNPEQANSAVELETAKRVFKETLPSRMVNPKTSAIVIVMQRLNANDVSGYILDNDFGYEHLMLPMEFEPERKCYTSIGFEDPRTIEGELLFEERFPREVVERDKKVMGAYATAGQNQQRPAPRGGGMFKRSDFEIIAAAPHCVTWVRGWDLAASKEITAARTAGVLMGVTPTGEFIIKHVTKGQFTAGAVEQLIRNTASQDGTSVKGSIPQDPGAGGKAWAIAIIKAAAGFPYTASTESGDKATRAEPFAAQVEIGNVKLVQGDWVEEFLDEAETFPAGKFKDQIDACSRAFMELTTSSTFEWYVGEEQ